MKVALMAACHAGLQVQYLTGPTIAKKMQSMKQIDRRISCAPMMDWTDARNSIRRLK
jgi:hypothetical protein